jgi:excinuclease ABC subunit A
VVIEHNLDVIKTADQIVDMGPEGGEEGGRLMAAGTPEEVAAVEESYTGEFLRGLVKAKAAKGGRRRAGAAGGRTRRKVAAAA